MPRKCRGKRTHGRGKKKGRGAGLRGGRGNAGLHKHKFISLIKYMPDHFGRKGFKRPQSMIKVDKTINIGNLNLKIEKYLIEGKVKENEGIIEIDLNSLGYNKLLGSGTLDKKLKITVEKASNSAVEKIRNAGGEIINGWGKKKLTLQIKTLN